jgi:2-phospho-L-lactate guanylyltransferase
MTCAILPIKAFRRSKTRLRPILSQSQCAAVARLMALDMLQTLCSVPSISRVLVVGQGEDQARLARMHGCDYTADDTALDISANLTRIARQPPQAQAEALLYVPSDLALVRPADICRLLAAGRPGITICRAIRDGGTNALLASPPGRLAFSFGAGSCERHARSAMAEGRAVHVLDEVSFQRDVDVPEDLFRVCRDGGGNNLLDYLQNSGLASRLASLFPESLAS